ncbi:hypothetical protein KGQ20_43775 [Catenulispora sp. NF23]|uniref:Secreted protein n=1 Tax=Catenulispora pinistramenti TaxID=2705254 RepID=A0ABS5L7S0_9ACTN|nr:hypothetical protein [Catenulispora pinistramenti]MBS2539684.1 hypothetical protein [Catenulispora pinistramenti]MBS2554418.1 hypothetical protein [Catenulispora pinistramenti]
MRKRILGAVVSAGLSVAAFPAVASAVGPAVGPVGPVASAVSLVAPSGTAGGWTTVTYTSRDYAAGTVCTYELKEDFPTQGVQERIVSAYPDGSPRQTDFRGPLIARYTNVATGAQIDEDLSGKGTLFDFPDKSSLWVIPDNFGLTVRAGDPYHAQGEYVLSQGSVVSVSPTGQIAIRYQNKVTDVCAALS